MTYDYIGDSEVEGKILKPDGSTTYNKLDDAIKHVRSTQQRLNQKVLNSCRHSQS